MQNSSCGFRALSLLLCLFFVLILVLVLFLTLRIFIVFLIVSFLKTFVLGFWSLIWGYFGFLGLGFISSWSFRVLMFFKKRTWWIAGILKDRSAYKISENFKIYFIFVHILFYKVESYLIFRTLASRVSISSSSSSRAWGPSSSSSWATSR